MPNAAPETGDAARTVASTARSVTLPSGSVAANVTSPMVAHAADGAPAVARSRLPVKRVKVERFHLK